MDMFGMQQASTKPVGRIFRYAILAIALAAFSACGDDSTGDSPTSGDDSLGTVTVTR